MTNFKDSVMAKVATGVVAFTAGLFMLGGAAIAPQVANAQSNEDLQAQIQSLLETIASLQAQVDGGTSAGVSGTCPASIFSLSAGIGAQGQAVQDLQVFLNMDADTQVALSGAGSPGQETTYYGQLTANAVSDFQAKYSANVLAPLGLSAPTGYWGSSSASQAQALCASMADDSDDDADDDDSDDSDDSDSDDLSGGEASIDNGYELDDADDVEEGSSAEVAEGEFDVEDGDVNVSRIDVSFFNSSDTQTDGDDEPWDVFEEVSIIVDGDEIASVAADDEDDWLDDDGEGVSGFDNDSYDIRFNDVDWVVRDGDTAEFTIAVETQSSVEDADQDLSWTVFIDDEGIRAVDSEGIQNYTGDADETAEFDIDEEGEGEELEVSSSSDDPDESIIQVEEDDTSDEYGVFAFDLEAEESDIEIDEVNVEVELGNLTYLADIDGNGTDEDYDDWFDDIVSDAYLEIDGEQFDVDSETVTTLQDDSDTSGTTTLTFDIDGDITIDADDEVTAMLFLEFNGTDDYNQSATVQASIANDGDIEGEGADDVASDGTVSGEEHTLLSSGVFSDDAADTSAETQGGDDEDRGFFSFEVDLTSFESDAYISATGSDAFNISLEGPNSNATTSVVLRDLGYDDETVDAYDYYVIGEGDTETFEIEVTVYDLESADEGNYHAVLDSVVFSTEDDVDADSSNSDGIDDSDTYDFTPESDYDTSTIFINQDA